MSTVDPRIPSQVRDLWASLDKETVWLHGRWIMYRQLYGKSSERLQLLNESAATFFNAIQDVLLHDVQLSISKLGDSAGSGSRTNLTLEALQKGLAHAGELVVSDKLIHPMSQFSDACIHIRHRRNKWIAHFDRDTMLNEATDPRLGPSRAEVEAALLALRNVMNCVSLHYTDTQIGYEYFAMKSDGESLIRCLRRGIRYEELVESGLVARDDFRNRFKGEV